jgi:hypothetical protein
MAPRATMPFTVLDQDSNTIEAALVMPTGALTVICRVRLDGNRLVRPWECIPVPTVMPAAVCSTKVEHRTATFLDSPLTVRLWLPRVIRMLSMIRPLTC